MFVDLDMLDSLTFEKCLESLNRDRREVHVSALSAAKAMLTAPMR
jgi:hypothetical protein